MYAFNLFPLTCLTEKVTQLYNLLWRPIMRFTGIKELKQNTMDILKKSEEEDIIITAYGKPMAILHHIKEDDLADYLIENDPAFKTRIEAAYTEYETHGGITVDAIIKKLEGHSRAKKV